MDIVKLSKDVKSLLSASPRINNFKTAIEELVFNSLDAESCSIAIRVHIPKMWIQVVDNGTGIKHVNYKLLGERYATSKLLDMKALKGAPSKYGYQGQALANLIEVSQYVKIISRCANSDETWVKVFSEGKGIGCHTVTHRPSKGTTVEINGFLFNQHIQKKSINPFMELLDIKSFLEQVALVFHNVSISLRDDSDMKILLKIHKNRDIYQTLSSLYEIDIKDLKELQIQKNEYKVRAFIGTNESEIKKTHSIYLNNKMLHNSNLHDFLNNKLSLTLNLNRQKIKKIKSKEIYNRDEVVNYKSIPLYFLFLNCPYYDYDIIYSGKQTIIEFRDWQNIYKLIEKLVEVYKDDLISIRQHNNYNQNQKYISESVEDTRNEAKKIIEKFLGNHNKNPRVSQMQNGVRGKQIKRKKKLLNVTLTRSKYTKCEDKYKNQNNILQSIDKKLTKNLDIRKVKYKDMTDKSKNIKSKCKDIIKANIVPKLRGKTLCSGKNANLKSRKFVAQRIKCKCFTKKNNSFGKFNNTTNMNIRKHDEVSSNMDYSPNLHKYDDVDERFSNHIINKKKSVTKPVEAKSLSALKKGDIFIKHNYLKHHSCDIQIKSYDLLKTILNTQQDFNNHNVVNEDINNKTYISLQSSNVYETTKYDCASKLTFESHKYIKPFAEKKRSRNFKKYNRLQNTLNNSPDKNNLNHSERAGTIITNQRYMHYNFKKQDFSTDNKELNKYHHDILKALNPSVSNIKGYSKNICYQNTKYINSVSDKAYHDKIQLQSKTSESFRINLNIESTYTIPIDSFQNSSGVLNVRKNCKTTLDESVIKDTYEYMNHEIKTLSSDIEVENNKKIDVSSINILSTFTDTFTIDEPIEPLSVCEVIIDENEVKNTNMLSNNKTKDTSLNVDFIENGVCVFKNKPPNDINSQVSIKAFEKDARNPENGTNVTCNDLKSNFTLINRHRFLPKGMSPIFENCFSKNICSYDLKTPYYEDKIYKNFVDDVAMNSELYEPKVQNMNELTTGHTKNFTDKIKKDRSDLVFGSESLKDAKVVFVPFHFLFIDYYVLGQVDCKFIAAKIHGKSSESSDFLVLFDQHAVHERIMLEHNLSYYFSGKKWKNVTIDTITVKVSKNDILYLHNHKDKFTQFGLEWRVLNDSEILVTSIPEAIIGRNSRLVDTIARSIKSLILEQISTIKCLKGNISMYPKSIMNHVFSEACRYAIKFGDVLSKKDCIELISQLAKCKTPFQCAHGRPVMAVMMELKLTADKYKVKTAK